MSVQMRSGGGPPRKIRNVVPEKVEDPLVDMYGRWRGPWAIHVPGAGAGMVECSESAVQILVGLAGGWSGTRLDIPRAKKACAPVSDAAGTFNRSCPKTTTHDLQTFTNFSKLQLPIL